MMGKHNLSNYILPGGDEQSEEDSSHWKVAILISSVKTYVLLAKVRTAAKGESAV